MGAGREVESQASIPFHLEFWKKNRKKKEEGNIQNINTEN
jgi:hypothetical protein